MLYHLSDALGSVRQLVDAGGEVKLARGYEPYGSVLSSSGNGSSAFAFTGEAQDMTTGLLFLRARYLSVGLGRFISRDTGAGEQQAPMSFNLWLYGYANPIKYVDRTGFDPENPCAGLPRGGDYEECTLRADIPPAIAADPITHNPAVNPWQITYNGTDLAPVTIIDSLSAAQAQFIPANYGYARDHGWASPRVPEDCIDANLHCGLCGLISIAAILNGGYPGGINANEVVDDFIAYNEYYNTLRYQLGRTWPDFQDLSELHGFINGTYFAYLQTGPANREGSAGIPDPIRAWLSQGEYAIDCVAIVGSSGKVGAGDAPHWLVVTGISHQWDKVGPRAHDRQRERSPWQWVRVYNPFTNRSEYYPYRFFEPAHAQFRGEMRVARYSRAHTQRWIDRLHIENLWCHVPEFIRRRLR